MGTGASSEGAAEDEILDQQLDDPANQAETGPATGIDTSGGGTPQPIPQQSLLPLSPSAPAVAFSTRIRASTTPAGMAPDRIPPRVDFPVGVAITNLRIPMAPIEITVAGSGGANGDVTVDGAASAQMNAGGTVQLRGTAQTTPGNAGNLRLVALWAGQQLASSNAFSVAAIPQDMVLSSHTLLTGSLRGIDVTQTWSSDSGSNPDLGEVKVSEAVQYVRSTGIFVGLGARNSTYIAASGGALTDSHSTPVAALTGAGVRVANQTEMFLDNRTGVTDIPMRNSGFVITRDVTATPIAGGSTIVQITTSKQGAAVTANGVSSAAGSGSISEPQIV